MSLIVLDNFLEIPSVVRQWAIKQNYYDSKEYTKMHGKFTDWPGKRTNHVFDLDQMYANIVLSKISALSSMFFGVKSPGIKSYFQLTTKQDGHSWVHQDSDVSVAGILYLNPDPPSNSGTTLYKCKDPSRWESYMKDSAGYETLKTINENDNPELYKSIFEPVDVVGNVFNRLIMYSGNQYHKSNNYFGENAEDGRLTQVFFITDDAP